MSSTFVSSSSSSSTVASASASSGCVQCGQAPACPQCADNEYCVLTELTCNQCPTTSCVTKSGSSSNSLNSSTSNSTGTSSDTGKIVGGVVGGVVGGLVVFAVVIFFIYRRYWKKKLKERSDRLTANRASYYDRDVEVGDEDEDDFSDSDSDSVIVEGDEEFAGDQIHDELGTLKRPISSSRTLAGDRNSTMTTQTKASNILPIAYIPGVTSGGGSSGTISGGSGGNNKYARLFRGLNTSNLNTAGDMRSHITLGSSILGGIDDEEEDEQQDNDLNNEKTNGSQENLTTAIRAKPKLVQIAEEDADDEVEGEKHALGGGLEHDHDQEHQHKQEEEQAHALEQEQEQEQEQDSDDDDDDGSFVLDVGIPDSIRQNNTIMTTEISYLNTNDDEEDTGSPFEDKFQI